MDKTKICAMIDFEHKGPVRKADLGVKRVFKKPDIGVQSCCMDWVQYQCFLLLRHLKQ